MTTKTLFCALAVAASLAACGGGDDPGPPPAATNTVPASALANAEAFSTYTGSVGADDTAEPLSVDKLEPPTSETAEPIKAG